MLLEENNLPRFNEKVLYTNATGLYTHPELLPLLKEAAFDRLEISRCHYSEEVNQKIMFINRNEPVYLNTHFERAVENALDYVDVKLSCILTKTGITSKKGIESYLDWAISLGVKEVVFRELSILNDHYKENNTKAWIDQNRVEIDPILASLSEELTTKNSHWEFSHCNTGYYYYNEHYNYKNKVEAIFETSSYNELIQRNELGVIQKLVFHSNGNLCGDWDPESVVISNYFN